MTTLPNPQMLEVPDAETLKEFEYNARAAWRLHHPEKKKKRGRRRVDREVFRLISEAWLELRTQEGMTQYKIYKHAWKKNKNRKEATYKKYTHQFVILLATAGNHAKLNDNDRKLIENATVALTRKVNRYQKEMITATEESERSLAPAHAALAHGLGEAAAEAYDAIVSAISKESVISSLQ